MDRVKQIWYLSHMRAAKVQARTFAARTYKHWVKRNLQTENQIPGPSEWLGMRSWNLSFGMLEDTNSLDGAHIIKHMEEYYHNVPMF